MANETIFKVTAYITRNANGQRQLLVFKEAGFEHLGFQVPGGTVEPNEELLDAVQREVQEEAGMIETSNIRLLGEHSYYSDQLSRTVKRYYYQMEAACPEQFTHVVQSNDEDNGWIYHYSWVDLHADLKLFSHLGAHLDKLG